MLNSSSSHFQGKAHQIQYFSSIQKSSSILDSSQQSSSDQFIMVGRRSKDQTQKFKKSNQRILHKSLILVSHLPQWFSNPQIIQKQILFGRYGKIKTIIISSNHSSYKKNKKNQVNQVQAYITYYNDFDASLAIKALNGYKIGTRVINATYGTNKYCASLQTNSQCKSSNCYFIHEKGQSDQVVTKNSLESQKQLETANKIINSNLQYFVRKIKEDSLKIKETKIYPSKLQTHTKYIIFPSPKQVIDQMIINGVILKYKFQQAREKVQIQQKITKKTLSETTRRIQYYRIRSKTEKNVQKHQKQIKEAQKQPTLVLQTGNSQEIKKSSSDYYSSKNQAAVKIQQPVLENLVLKSILQDKEQQQSKLNIKNTHKKRKYIKKTQREQRKANFLLEDQCSYLKLFEKSFKIQSDQIIQQCQSIQDTTTDSNRSSKEKAQKKVKIEEDFPTINNLNKIKKQNSQKVLKTNSQIIYKQIEDNYLITKVLKQIMKNKILKRSRLLSKETYKYNEEREKQWKHITKLMINSLLGSKKSDI